MVTSLKWIEKKIGYPSQSIYFYGIDEKEEKQIIFIAANASSYVICRRSSFTAFLSQQILFQRRENTLRLSTVNQRLKREIGLKEIDIEKDVKSLRVRRRERERDTEPNSCLHLGFRVSLC